MTATPAAAPAATPRPKFRRVFTPAQIEEAERDYNATFGVQRRIMQVVLTKPSGELLKIVWKMAKDEQGMEALTDMIESIKAFEAHLQGGLEAAQAAYARLMACAEYLAEENARV